MKQKLQLINQAHSIIYNNKKYKDEFKFLLPFRISDKYVTFQQCLIALQDYPFEVKDSTFYSLIDIITELEIMICINLIRQKVFYLKELNIS